MRTYNSARDGISRDLERLRQGATLLDVAHENGLKSHVGMIHRFERYADPFVYREALITGLRVRLKMALDAGETKRYRQTLYIASVRYPGVFVFPRKRGKTVDIRTVAAVSHLGGESGSK